MNRTGQKENELLSRVVERFLFHMEKAGSDNPIVSEIARKMCGIGLCEMWILTQK